MRNRIALFLVLLITASGCAQKPIRFATFNASLNREKPGKLLLDLSTKDDPQIKNVAEIIQRANPDVLLINEFDYDHDDRAVHLFQVNYLAVPQNGAAAIKFPYHYTGPVNTGVASGYDLDHDGKAVITPGTRQYGNDAIGFGQFPGQYGMVLMSKFPIEKMHIRTFQRFKWKNMPDAMLPTDKDGKPWYSDEALEVLRLSSKSHWDVPIEIDGKAIHVLVSHPTPPAFDGPEDRNGKRNHDEIRFWADYISGGIGSMYISDDTAVKGRDLKPLKFVVMGDENADPNDGGSVSGAIDQLLKHPRVNASFTPTSKGAVEAAQNDGGNNAQHKTPAAADTADFDDTGSNPGNLRCDYVLPCKEITIVGGAVFWPASTDPLARLVQMTPVVASSDHRLVYVDLKW